MYDIDYQLLRKTRRRERFAASIFLAISTATAAVLMATKSPVLSVVGVIPAAVATLRFKSLDEDADVVAANKTASLKLKQKQLDKELFPARAMTGLAVNPVEDVPMVLEFYDWNDAIDEAVGFIISGQSGAGKTSVACWLAGLITKSTPCQIIALDPHFNDTWDMVGVMSEGRIPEIERILQWFLDELDRRLELKRTKQPLGDPILVFCDEIGSCLLRFKDPKLVANAIQRLGSEGRKFGLTFILLNQSPNAEDLGISAKYLDNYFQVALGSVVRAIADQQWRDNDIRKKHIKEAVYPCLVCRSVPIQVAIHPTHHTYKKYKKHGNPPKDLIPVRQLQLNIPVVSEDALEVMYTDDVAGVTTIEATVSTAESCPHCGSYEIKWLSQKAGRKQCKKCNKTWSIK